MKNEKKSRCIIFVTKLVITKDSLLSSLYKIWFEWWLNQLGLYQKMTWAPEEQHQEGNYESGEKNKICMQKQQ